MTLYIPCLNPDTPDDGSGWSVGVGAIAGGGDSGGLSPGVTISNSDVPFTLTIGPVPPFLGIGINFQFWSDLFGLGETRIHREKEQIQAVGTSIFQFLHTAYGVPITDNHWLEFPSDGVQAQFTRRPDIAALVPSFMQTAKIMADLVFARQDSSTGEQEREVNQFLANAAYNNWPVDATVSIWEGLIDAANPACSQDPSRWMRNPQVIQASAEMATILSYIPLSVLVDMAARHLIGDGLAERLILLWANHPELVASIPHVDKYDWQGAYTRGEWCLPPYRIGLGDCLPLLQRQEIKQILTGLQVQLPRYPDFLWPQGVNPFDPGTRQGIPLPNPQPVPQPQPQPQPQPVPQPQPQPIPVPSQQPGPPPLPGIPWPPNRQTLESPNQQDLDRACQIAQQLAAGQTLTLPDNNWLLTQIGAQAWNKALQNPQCWPQGPQPTPSPIPQPDPNCPPVPQPQPNPQPQPQPWPLPSPIPQPNPRPGPQPPPCPPDCQTQIDILWQKQQECCDETRLYVVPQLQDIWRWLQDLENRVPGPAPTLPFPPGQIPTPGNLPPAPVPLPEPIPEPIPEPTPITPTPIGCEQILECLITNCDQVNTILEQCKEKSTLTDCQEGIEKWGRWAECWLDTYTIGIPPGPDSYPQERSARYAIGQAVEVITQEPGNIIGAMVQSHIARAKAIISGNTSAMDTPVTTPIPLIGYIFQREVTA